jgi:hypothetical protein
MLISYGSPDSFEHGFEKPLNPTMAILFEFQQEFSFMASLGNMPDLIRNVVSFRRAM